jgi:hypothetical protein
MDIIAQTNHRKEKMERNKVTTSLIAYTNQGIKTGKNLFV